MAKTKGELSLWNKIAFGMGDIYGGGSMIIVGIYYLYFLTDVVGLSPALAGTVLLISKIWDAVNDPLMGVITDRTRTRFGRRRPVYSRRSGLQSSSRISCSGTRCLPERGRARFRLRAPGLPLLRRGHHAGHGAPTTRSHSELPHRTMPCAPPLVSIRMGFSMFVHPLRGRAEGDRPR
jgi:hypothetical protein